MILDPPQKLSSPNPSGCAQSWTKQNAKSKHAASFGHPPSLTEKYCLHTYTNSGDEDHTSAKNRMKSYCLSSVYDGMTNILLMLSLNMWMVCIILSFQCALMVQPVPASVRLKSCIVLILMRMTHVMFLQSWKNDWHDEVVGAGCDGAGVDLGWWQSVVTRHTILITFLPSTVWLIALRSVLLIK